MPTQKDVAAHLDLNDRTVRVLLKNGVLPPSKGPGGYDVDACRVSYIRHLRGVASGQHSAKPGAPDLTAERARKERAQAEKTEFELAVKKQEYAPIEVLEDVLAKAVGAMVAKFDSYTARLDSSYPGISKKDRKRLAVDVYEIRTSIADIEISH